MVMPFDNDNIPPAGVNPGVASIVRPLFSHSRILLFRVPFGKPCCHSLAVALPHLGENLPLPRHIPPPVSFLVLPAVPLEVLALRHRENLFGSLRVAFSGHVLLPQIAPSRG